jgi:hypothetical protein
VVKVTKKQLYNYYTPSTPQSGMSEALATKAAKQPLKNSQPQDKAVPVWEAKNRVLTAAIRSPFTGRGA